jgi:Polyketide cyclase / dehydrase and lipid transport
LPLHHSLHHESTEAKARPPGTSAGRSSVVTRVVPPHAERVTDAVADTVMTDAVADTVMGRDCTRARVSAIMRCWVKAYWPAGDLDPGVALMAERHIMVEHRIPASTGSVWAVLADFPNLARHWEGLRSTTAVGEQTSGVGARRRVELKPIGSMDETVIVWQEGRRIDTKNEPRALVPFAHAASSLTLKPEDDETVATFDYRYRPRGGPIGRITGPLIDRMLTGTFNDMLMALEKAALRYGYES